MQPQVVAACRAARRRQQYPSVPAKYPSISQVPLGADPPAVATLGLVGATDLEERTVGERSAQAGYIGQLERSHLRSQRLRGWAGPGLRLAERATEGCAARVVW